MNERIEPLMVSAGGIPYNKAHLDEKDRTIQSLRAALAKSEEARETAERERDVAQSACTAWQGIFEGLEAHLMDRVNMGDEAAPETYLRILRGYVADIIRDSKAIANARWADYGRHETSLRAAEASLSQALARIEELETDAERWRALMSSQRMHFMGCAGIDLVNKPGTTDRTTANLIPIMKPGTYQHFGMEFWSQHSAFGNPEFPDDFERSLLVAYVDHLRALPATPIDGGKG